MSKVGYEMKLYVNSGSYGSPTWDEVTICKNLRRNKSRGEADTTTRGNNGWRRRKPTLKDFEATFELDYVPDNTEYLAIRDAFDDADVVELAFADGDIATPGTEYFRCECGIFQFELPEDLETAVMANVTARYSGDNTPSYVIVPTP